VLTRDALALIYVVFAVFSARSFWTDALKFAGRWDFAFAVVAWFRQTRIDWLLTKPSFPAFIAFAAEVVDVVSAFAVLARIGRAFVYVLGTVSTCPSFGTNAAVIVVFVVAFPVAARIVGLCAVVCSPLTVVALVAFFAGAYEAIVTLSAGSAVEARVLLAVHLPSHTVISFMTWWTGAVVANFEVGILDASPAVEARLFLLTEVDWFIASFASVSALTFALPASRAINAGAKGTTGVRVEAFVDVLLAGLSFPAIEASAYGEAVFVWVAEAVSTGVDVSRTVVVAFVRQVTACSRFARRTFASVFSQLVDANASFGAVVNAAVVVVDLAVGAAEAVYAETIVAAHCVLTSGAVFAATAHRCRAFVYVQRAVLACPASSAVASVAARHVLADAAVVTLVVGAVVHVLGAVRTFEADVALADRLAVRALFARAVYTFRRVAGLRFCNFAVISTPARRAHAIVTFSIDTAASAVLAWSQVAEVVRPADGRARS